MVETTILAYFHFPQQNNAKNAVKVNCVKELYASALNLLPLNSNKMN